VIEEVVEGEEVEEEGIIMKITRKKVIEEVVVEVDEEEIEEVEEVEEEEEVEGISNKTNTG
jgi:hypothetical protein